MSLVSFTPVTDGSTATAAGVNTPLSTIYNDYNGNITNANLSASAAIDFSKVSGGSSTALGAWQSWTPTLTNGLLGNGSFDCQYSQVGKVVNSRFKWTLGSTSTVSAGELQYTLPVTATNKYGGGTLFYGIAGQGVFYDSSASAYFSIAGLVYSTTVGNINAISASGAFTQLSSMSGFSYGVNDVVFVTLTYEAA